MTGRSYGGSKQMKATGRIETKTITKGVMTASEVAAFLKVSISAVRRWTREGKLRGHRLGGAGDWRYLEADVMRFFYGEVPARN
jgi:excisionase family DNA binding protein